MKILVVDDEELLVKGIRFNLQNEGYEVITGANGVEAVESYQGRERKCSRIHRFSNDHGVPHSP